MRLAQTQVWPALRYLEAMEPSTAASRSASSNTMNGALPPSSSESFLIVSADWRMRMRPVSVEPVNESFRTFGLAHSSAPIALESPVMTLSTPFGMPARSPSSAMASAEYGVWLAGLITAGQPDASAGPALRVIIAFGKFHGVINAATPIGCLMTRMLLSGHGTEHGPGGRFRARNGLLPAEPFTVDVALLAEQLGILQGKRSETCLGGCVHEMPPKKKILRHRRG